MCTAKPSWKSMTVAEMTYKKCMFNINIHLDGIISIDTKTQVSANNKINKILIQIIFLKCILNVFKKYL